MQLARLFVLLSLDSKMFQSGMIAAIRQVEMFQARMGALNAAQALQSVGRGLTYGLTLPILAAAAAIGVFGSQLDSEMARVQSVIATPENSGIAQIMQWRSEVQGLATDLGRTSPEVAGGLYEIVSAFGNLSNATDFLRVAAKAAVAGQSDIVTSTKNLVLATRAWGDSSTEAVQRMADLASATVRIGTVTESELGPAMAGLLPIAKLYNVQLEDAFAGLASLAGVSGTASQASTQLQRAITSLVAPNTTLTKLYRENGIASGEWLIQQYGLLGAFQEIVRIANESDTPLQKVLGRIEGLKAIATLTGPQLDAFKDNLAELGNAAGSVDVAFAGATGGISMAQFQWQQAIQRMRVTLENLYLAFSPAALNIAEAFAPIGSALEGLAQSIAELPTDKLTTILWALLGLAALGPTLSILGGLVRVFGALGPAIGATAAVITGLAWPLLLVAGAVLLLWFAWRNNWGNIQERTADAVRAIQEHLGPLREALSDAGTAMSGIWEAVKNADVQGLLQSLEDLKAAFRHLGGEVVLTAIQTVGDFFNIDTTPIQNAAQYVLDLYEAIANVKSVWEGMGILAGQISRSGVELPNGILPGQGPDTTAYDRAVAESNAANMRNAMANMPTPSEVWGSLSNWWNGVSDEFAKGYTQSITTAVRNTQIAPMIGPPTLAQVQAGLRNVQIGPAVAPAFATGFTTGVTTGVTGANWNSVTSALTTRLTTTTQQPVDSMVQAMKTQLGQALASDTITGIVGPALESAIDQAVKTTDFTQVGQQFVTAIQTTMTQVRSAISSANLPALMRSQLSLVVIALTTSGATMVSAARTIVANIKIAFTGAGWSSVGVSISSGIAAGISSGAGAIRSAAAAAASSAYSAAMSALKANSPSRLMMAPGLYASQGMAVGILSGIGYIQSATNAMLAPLTGIATGGVGGGGFAMAGVGGSTTTSNTTYGDINIYVTAGGEATGKEIGISITQALQRKGLL